MDPRPHGTEPAPAAVGPTRTVLTMALPYANGPLHAGHGTEHVMADVHARHLRMKGELVAFVCGDDQHGSACELAAQRRGITPAEYIAEVERDHLADLHALGVSLDHYQGTHSDHNRRLTSEVFLAMRDQGLIERRVVQQLFDPEAGRFLADRHVRGECPHCGAREQYGDNCDSCGATYTALELRNPVSVHSGATPVVGSSEQLYFRLSHLAVRVRRWLADSGAVDEATARKASEWVDGDLQDWCISRSAPYFGFEIPGEPGKFFYVWVDAPMGYLAATMAWCEKNNQSFADIWRAGQQSAQSPRWRIVHVIGKDIQKFHSVFFPAMLSTAGFRTPDRLAVHGFLSVNGRKMSKRDGTLLTLKALLQQVPPEALRYYLASKLSTGQADIDLDFADFERKVNGDLVGKLVNVASRTAPLLQQHFNNVLADRCALGAGLLASITAAASPVMALYDEFDSAGAIRQCMALADEVNRFVEQHAPWRLARNPEDRQQLHEVLTVALQGFASITAYLNPVVPQLAERAFKFLGIEAELRWGGSQIALWGRTIQPYARLLDRVAVDSLEAARLASIPSTLDDTACSAVQQQPLLPPTDEATWLQQDLRVARVLDVKLKPGQPGDLLLQLDYGDGTPCIAEVPGLGRTPLKLADLLGRLVIGRVNAGSGAQGPGRLVQLCTARGEGAEVYLCQPAEGARPGMRIT